jgi:hypothetical protein
MPTGMRPDDDQLPTLRILRHPLGGVAPTDELASEIAEIQSRADLGNAKGAASLLTTGGLRELRAWIDSQLRAW